MTFLAQLLRINVLAGFMPLFFLVSAYAQNTEKADSVVKIEDTSLVHVVYNRKIYGLGYFTVNNTGEEDHLISNVTSPRCNKVTAYHTDQESSTETANLFSHMALPAHSVLVFPLGGYHLVCIEPKSSLQIGEVLDFTFSFLDKSQLKVQFKVTKFSNP